MLKSFDYFRKIQTDQELTSATGGVFTLIALIVCTNFIQIAAFLVYYSFKDYYSSSYQTFLDLRNDQSQYLPMHIDILFDKMPCNALTLQFYDELEYSQSNLEEKLTLSHYISANNQLIPYKRQKNIDLQQRALRNGVQNGFGCRISGFLPLPRTPGTLVFKPTAIDNLMFSMDQHLFSSTRMRYRIETLQFGTNSTPFELPITHKSKKIQNYLNQLQGKNIKRQYVQDFTNQTRTLDYFNHLKIIPISIEDENQELSKSGKRQAQKYRYSLRNGVALVENQPINAVMFLTEIEPIHIVYRKQVPKLFDLIIEILAIVGGTMATLGLINSASHHLFSIK